MSEQAKPRKSNVYERFIEELDAMTIHADDPVAAVVGALTRAVKRAQMVVDGDLPPVATRKGHSQDYVDGLFTELEVRRVEKKDAADD